MKKLVFGDGDKYPYSVERFTLENLTNEKEVKQAIANIAQLLADKGIISAKEAYLISGNQFSSNSQGRDWADVVEFAE